MYQYIYYLLQNFKKLKNKKKEKFYLKYYLMENILKNFLVKNSII